MCFIFHETPDGKEMITKYHFKEDLRDRGSTYIMSRYRKYAIEVQPRP